MVVGEILPLFIGAGNCIEGLFYFCLIYILYLPAIKRQNDYVLYDVRSRGEYGLGHIKTAESISIVEVLSQESITRLLSGRNVYIYSEDSGQAAQVVTLLRSVGVPAYYLVGGYQAWTAAMQNVAADGTPLEQANTQAVACWFEGDYIAEAGLVVKPAGGGGYVPPLEPVKGVPEEDSLGLGLGIGLGPEPAEAEEDSLGLGLGLGLGPEDAQEPEASPRGGKLKIGEGC